MGDTWPKSDSEPVEVITEQGTYQAILSAENYATIEKCWTRGCGCEQANSPITRGILMAILLVCITLNGRDAMELLKEKFKGKKKEKKEKKERKEKKEKKEKKRKEGDETEDDHADKAKKHVSEDERGAGESGRHGRGRRSIE